MLPQRTYIAGAKRSPGAVQHPTLPDKLIRNAHGGGLAAPPPGSGSTAVGIVCRLPNGAALIAAGFPPNPLGFLIAKPATRPFPRVAAGIAFSPMPWVCADSPARPRNSSVGSARPQLPNYRARRLPNRNPRTTLDPSHAQQCGGENGSKAAQVVPGSAHV